MSISQAPQLNGNFFYAEYVAKRYVCTIPSDLSFDEVLEPSFWTHVGYLLRQWDRIEVRPDGAAYVAELAVISAGPLFAKVAVVSKQDLAPRVDDAGKLSVEQVGKTFRVRRGRDVMKEGLDTRKEADRWIEDYTVNVKAKAA